MGKTAKKDQDTEQDREASSHDSNLLMSLLREEFQAIKAQNAQHEMRLARLEELLNELAKGVKHLSARRKTEPISESLDEYISHQIEPQQPVDAEDTQPNWEYIVARKGGYDDVLYLSVHDLLELEADPIRFILFLIHKQAEEMKRLLGQLQAEYARLNGSQLQEHFRELWKSHYLLLKKKIARTWQEEVFLKAFDAFITWLQQA